MKKPKSLNIFVCLIPVGFLIFLLFTNIKIFKDDASYGSNQIALILSGALAALIGFFNYHIPYKEIETKIIDSIGVALQSIMILLTVGALIGLWMLAGIVPAIIYYGLAIIEPSIFLPVSCVVAGIVALATGSSWSTTGTLGVGLMVIGQTLGIPSGIVAGAVISGAYFGDKMSPLSDTTNLAPAVAGTDLFTHIRHMVYSTGPSIILTILGFIAVGMFFGESTVTTDKIDAVMKKIETIFHISPLLFIAPAMILIMVALKVPALPTLLLGCVVGAIIAITFQSDLLSNLGGSTISSIYQKIITVAVNGFKIDSGTPEIDKLLSRGGMSGMLNTVWLILSAMIFGGAMEATGFLEKLATSLLAKVKSTFGLVCATAFSCIFTNITAGDQYIAIIFPGRLFKKAYEKFNLHAKNLSRALEDSGTVTSVLVPWNSGGAYNSGILGVATLEYLPYCFFNLISPIVSIILGLTGWTFHKKNRTS